MDLPSSLVASSAEIGVPSRNLIWPAGTLAFVEISWSFFGRFLYGFTRLCGLNPL